MVFVFRSPLTGPHAGPGKRWANKPLSLETVMAPSERPDLDYFSLSIRWPHYRGRISI